MSRLAGKVALITASKGIGTALANGLAAARASVAVTYASDRSSAEAVVTAITASGAAGARLLFPRRKPGTKEIQMNNSSNLLVLGVTGQVGKLVAKNLRRSDAHFSVGTRRKANLEDLADQFGASRFYRSR